MGFDHKGLLWSPDFPESDHPLRFRIIHSPKDNGHDGLIPD